MKRSGRNFRKRWRRRTQFQHRSLQKIRKRQQQRDKLMRLMNRCRIGPGKLFYPPLNHFNIVEKQNKCLCLSSGYKCMDSFPCMLFLKILILSDCFVFYIYIMWVGFFLSHCCQDGLFINVLNFIFKYSWICGSSQTLCLMSVCSFFRAILICRQKVYYWGFCSGTWHCVTGYMLPDILRQWNGLIFEGWNI